MNKNIQILIPNFKDLINSFQYKKLRFIFVLLSGVLLVPLQQTRSEVIFLKCIGKYEINRGALIKPDWETSYLTINLNGLISTIDEKGIKKEGRTLIRRNSYTITHRDNRNSVKDIYKINGKHGTYSVESPQRNRTLIGTCQKGRG
ncbi:hypothetical protein [Prochlorococcus marinus]|uniref:hypothetical protein n=1 Tax=Prochlorococcus marinus TaxID=1219 RepID=UPI0022B5D49C|nr:hypothetical protein [Prochlorococcus marinus]